MKYAIKKTDSGVLVKRAPQGKVSQGKGWEIVSQLPDGSLYRETFDIDGEGEYVSVKKYFTAEMENQNLNSIYAQAFNRLLVNREIHQKGIGYPTLSKAALAELENNHEDAESLYRAALSSLLG